jgi:hypothetical protein
LSLPDKVVVDRKILEDNIIMKYDKCKKELQERRWKLRGTFCNIINMQEKGPSPTMVAFCKKCNR